MKILVTGGDGQLGTSLRKFAGDYKDHVFTFIDVHDLDLTDSSGVAAYLTEHQPHILRWRHPPPRPRALAGAMPTQCRWPASDSSLSTRHSPQVRKR